MNTDDFRTHLSLACPPLNGPVISSVISRLMTTAKCDGCIWGVSGTASWRERERQEGGEGEGVCVRRGAQEPDWVESMCPGRGAALLFLSRRKNVSPPSQAALASRAFGKNLLWEPPVLHLLSVGAQAGCLCKMQRIPSSRVQGGHE